MAGSIVMDNRTFKRGVDAMMKAYNTDAAGVMRRQMSIVSGQLAKRYPPNKKSTGVKAIAKDLLGGRSIAKGNKSVGIFNTDKDELAQYSAADYSGLANLVPTAHVIKTKSGAVYGVDNKLYRPDASLGEIRSHHEKYKSKKTGRVTTAGSFDHVIGRWKFVDKMYVREATMKQYIKERARKVGKLKGAWASGAVKWKGGARQPEWVTEHSMLSLAIDRMGTDGSGYLEIRNPVEGAARWGRIDKFVMQSRQRGFIKELKAAIRAADKAGNKIR